MYADYSNGLTNLACSILKHYGAEYTHNTLRIMDDLLEYPYKNVVVMLFDGMGMDALSYHLQEESFLRKHLVTGYSSVFPPTTTAATTSLESGLNPVEHGWIGWSLYFSEIDKIVNIFTNKEKETKKDAADYHVAGRYIPIKRIFDKINETNHARAYSVSKFGSVKIDSLDELFSETKNLCLQEGNKYIYTYWDEPDFSMHDNGCYDRSITTIIQDINRRVEDLCGELSNTLVIVTADHGHCSLEHYVLSDYPQLLKMLERPTAIETRASVFYVKPEYLGEFPIRFRELFGEDFLLLSGSQVIEQKIFGDGIPHPKFREFIGDYIAIATTDKGIVYSTKSNQFQSNHAGMTDKEMFIPLIAFEAKE